MQKPDLQYCVTADGSYTFYVREMDECYHSIYGALQESRHVFIDQGLKQINASTIRILEVGFGTGLNALLTGLEALDKGLQIFYHAIECHPLAWEVVKGMNYGAKINEPAQELFEQIHRAAWEQEVAVSPNFSLQKIQHDFCQFEPSESYDLIYFDAFAPEKQPAMWEQAHHERLFRALKPGGLLVTYSAKGLVKRMLRATGYHVSRVAGPPGKHQMLRAEKPK